MKPKRVLKWIVGTIALALPVTAVVAYARSTNSCGQDTATPREPMKAIVYCDYGSPDVLALQSIDRPSVGDSQVLVKVHSASVNPLDWHYVRGTPYIGRLDMGLRKPKITRLGVDFAGTIVSVGTSVTRFKPGDEVFGARTGAFAEYVTARADRIALKPANISFEQAAAVPVAALTALQGLRDHGKLQAGQKVLINGASGGVGTFAVQIAKALGAEVTGVCSGRNVEMVRSIGADHVIDYTKEDFTKRPERYDVVIDNVGNHSLSAMRHIMQPSGRYVMVGGPSGRWLDPMPRALGALVQSMFASQEMSMFISQLNEKDLTLLAEMMQAGKITPVIDRRYPLAEVPAAVAYLETGRARGKVIITIE
jgi:NADPH:quinone reductase-like Zn-dependent oxidoreductase